MYISPENITSIARLARLKTDTKKSEFYAAQLTKIMELVEQINRINTDGIEPMLHPQDTTMSLREDDVVKSNHREEYQALAPSAENGLYLVPKVIE